MVQIKNNKRFYTIIKKSIPLHFVLGLMFILSFFLVSCDAENENAILGTSVNELPTDVDVSNWLNGYFLSDNNEDSTRTDSIIKITEDYKPVANVTNLKWHSLCYSADSVYIASGFRVFEFKIINPTTMYCSFKNDNCGCDDVTFQTNYFTIYQHKDKPNKILIRILRIKNKAGSLVQIEGILDDYNNITEATSYFVDFLEFGLPKTKSFFEHLIAYK